MTDLLVLTRVNSFGGSERHTIDLVNDLTASGWRVTLVQSGLDLVPWGIRREPGRLEVVTTRLPMRNLTRADQRAWRRLLGALPAERALLVKPWYHVADLRCLAVIRGLYPRVLHIEHSLPPELGRPVSR